MKFSGKFFFIQNYCHACYTRFAVFFLPPSCCVSLLMIKVSAGTLRPQLTSVSAEAFQRLHLLNIYYPSLYLQINQKKIGQNYLAWKSPR